MIKLKKCGLIISGNSKTGLSMNWGLCSCRPTKLCTKICYARFRDREDARRLGTSANTGPITWGTQQKAYMRNSSIIEEAHKEDMNNVFEIKEATRLWDIADEMAQALHNRGENNIRWNGQGDLTYATVRLIYLLSQYGIHVWGFTRKAHELRTLGMLLNLHGGSLNRPFFQVSIDETTKDAEDLISAAQLVSPREKRLVALAVMAGKPSHSPQLSLEALEARRWIDGLVYRSKVRTVFGYHTSFGHTIVGVSEECPATRGDKIVCWQCRRCWGED